MERTYRQRFMIWTENPLCLEWRCGDLGIGLDADGDGRWVLYADSDEVDRFDSARDAMDDAHRRRYPGNLILGASARGI